MIKLILLRVSHRDIGTSGAGIYHGKHLKEEWEERKVRNAGPGEPFSLSPWPMKSENCLWVKAVVKKDQE